MAKKAFLYAGQGSQVPGMGKSFYDRFPVFRDTIDRAAGRVSFDLRTLMFEGPAEKLAETQYTQVCLAAFAAGVTNVLSGSGIRPDIVAGLSLGEYSALYAAGVFDEETLIDVTAFRGQAMAEAGEGLRTKMTAILGLPDGDVEAAAEEGRKVSGAHVWVSNYNAAGQVVISGDAAGVKAAEDAARRRGAKRCVPVRVSSAFHTPYMEPASEALCGFFRNVEFRPMQIPVVFNATGRTLTGEETIPDLLVRQVKSPLRMSDTLRLMEKEGVTETVEIGPGHVLTGFLRRTVSIGNNVILDEAEDLEQYLDEAENLK